MSTPFFSTLTAFRRKKYTQFEPLIIHQRKPLKYHCFKGFSFEYFEYEFPALSLKLQHFQGFSFLGNFYPTFVLQAPSGDRALITHVKHQCFQRFWILSFEYIEYFCTKHYKSGLSEQFVRWCRLPPFFSENNDSNHPLQSPLRCSASYNYAVFYLSHFYKLEFIVPFHQTLWLPDL